MCKLRAWRSDSKCRNVVIMYGCPLCTVNGVLGHERFLHPFTLTPLCLLPHRRHCKCQQTHTTLLFATRTLTTTSTSTPADLSRKLLTHILRILPPSSCCLGVALSVRNLVTCPQIPSSKFFLYLLCPAQISTCLANFKLKFSYIFSYLSPQCKLQKQYGVK